MSLWPVIRDLFIRRAAEVVIEEVVETAQEALSNREQDKKESTKRNKQGTNQKRPNKK
jgi:hypothetical protein